MSKKAHNKTRINITVDKNLLEKARIKLNLFGGKLSTLFNAYLNDFVNSIDKNFDSSHKNLISKVKELESRIKELEKRI